MSDQDLNIRIRAEDDASPVIEKLRDQLAGLARDFGKAFRSQNVGAGLAREAETFTKGQRDAMSALRSRFAFESRMRRQQQAEAKEAADADKLFQGEAVTALRQRMAFSSRMYRQQAQEARDSAREQADAARTLARQQQELARAVGRAARQAAQEHAQGARDAARAARDAAREQATAIRAQIAQARVLERAQARAHSTLAGGGRDIRSGLTRTVVAGAATAAVAGHEARRGLDALTRSGVGIDEALTQAGIHVYGQLPASEARKAAESLRQRLMPIATKLGSSTADLIGAYVEASQAGVDSDILDKVTEFGSKYAKMNKLSLPNTLEETGYALQGLKSFGTVNDDTVSKYFNHMSYLVATTAANRSQMSAFGKRGLAAGASIGMSPDDTLAFGAAASAAGAQGNQAARMLSTTDKRVAGWSLKAHDIQRKHHRTDEDRLFLQAPGLLGYGSHDDMARAFKANPFDALVQSFEGLKKITDPLKRLNLEKQLFGQEFGTFTDAMVMGGNLREYRERLRSKDADNFIDQNWSKQTGSLGFMVDQIKKTWTDLSDSLGLVLKPFYQDLRDYAVQIPGAFASFENAFRASLSGFVSGLGSPDGTLAGLLKAWFGNPGEFKLDAASWGSFFHGLGQGIKDIADAVRQTASLFGSGAGGMKTLGRLTGEFLALSTALVALGPALVALSGLTAIVKGIVGVGRGLVGLFRFGAVGEGGLTAGSFAGLGRLLTGSAILGIAGYLGSHRGEIVTAILDAMSAIWEAFKRDLRKRFTLKNILDELIPAPVKRFHDGGTQGPAYTGQDGLPGLSVGSDGKPVIGASPSSYSPPGGGGTGQGFFGRVGSAVKRAFGFGGSGSHIGKAQQNANSSAVMAELKAAGYKDNAIAAIMGSMQTESHFDPSIRNSSGHTGLWQWDGAKRWPKIAAWIKAQGGNPNDARWQTKAWIAEHNAKPGDTLYDGAQTSRGGAILRGDPSLGEAVEGVRMSERFGIGEEGGRAANARAWLPHVQGGTSSATLAGDPGEVGKRVAALKSAGAIANEQCVALAKAYVGVSGSVKDWRRGVGADAGTLKPGTPIATFLNRDGSQSERYAGGGTGTPGAKLDHAAVFQSYILGKDGKPVGMRVAEQFAGSGGPRWKDYTFGQGFGEVNGANYHAIKSAVEGTYLGGKNNPMNRIEQPTPADMAASVGSPGSRPGDDMMGARHHHHGPVSINLTTPPDDPEATAKAINRQLQIGMNRRAHDVASNYA